MSFEITEEVADQVLSTMQSYMEGAFIDSMVTPDKTLHTMAQDEDYHASMALSPSDMKARLTAEFQGETFRTSANIKCSEDDCYLEAAHKMLVRFRSWYGRREALAKMIQTH